MYPFPKFYHRGSALLIGMWLIIILTVIWVVFLEKIWRFSDQTENIEQSNASYYLATSAIEEAIYTTDKRTPWGISLIGTGTIQTVWYTGAASPFTQVVPRPGNGNSDFDPNWNIISLGDPVQIVIPNGVRWNDVNFYFRVPDLDNNPVTNRDSLDVSLNGKWIVNWVIAASTEALFASGETNVFTDDEIIDWNNLSPPLVTIQNKSGNTSSGWSMIFDFFYSNSSHLNGTDPVNGKCLSFWCTMKLSLLRPILLTWGKSIPFLEYKIDFTAWFPAWIPDQFINLSTKGYSNGFLRTRTIQIPQITTNTALDFTILQ